MKKIISLCSRCLERSGWLSDPKCILIYPQKAFQKKIQIDNPLGVNELPGRTGVYSRPLCKNQMALDRENAGISQDENNDRAEKAVKCCRLCETACPVGKK